MAEPRLHDLVPSSQSLDTTQEYFKTKPQPGAMALIFNPSSRKQRQVGLSSREPGLHSEFQARQE